MLLKELKKTQLEAQTLDLNSWELSLKIDLKNKIWNIINIISFIDSLIDNKKFDDSIILCESIINNIKLNEEKRLKKLWVKSNASFLANFDHNLIFWIDKIENIRKEKFLHICKDKKDFLSAIIYCENLIKFFQKNDEIFSKSNNCEIIDWIDTQNWKINLKLAISLYSQELINKWDEKKAKEISDYYLYIWDLKNY